MRSETETLKSERDYANAEQRSRVLDIVVREVKKFGTLFLYLALVFGLFTLHQWVVLASNHISYVFYGASVINALILAKIMLVAEALHFGERFRDKPLAYPILYKSVAFGLMLVIAYVAEEVIVGLLKGESLAQSAPELGGGTPAGIAAIALIMCVALIPFFAFKELRRVYGGA
ncbi:MAG TPA: hypothetical protein DCL72_01140, partial [Rhizobiales bacterium]|nr:hypothetical protein [Hyphomicrobiales bacterium]